MTAPALPPKPAPATLELIWYDTGNGQEVVHYRAEWFGVSDVWLITCNGARLTRQWGYEDIRHWWGRCTFTSNKEAVADLVARLQIKATEYRERALEAESRIAALLYELEGT